MEKPKELKKKKERLKNMTYTMRLTLIIEYHNNNGLLAATLGT